MMVAQVVGRWDEQNKEDAMHLRHSLHHCHLQWAVVCQHTGPLFLLCGSVCCIMQRASHCPSAVAV